MDFLYDFPDNAKFGKNIPKSKIYENANPSTKIKELFVKQVDKINWSYKLSPETINLPAKGGVQEIQVFTIELKTDKLKQEVLHTIDKVIPSPILFVISFKDKIKYSAAYKRPNEADKSKWVISCYFETDWIPKNAQSANLPVALDMKSFYQQMMTILIPLNLKEGENIDSLITRVEEIQKLERECDKLEKRIKKEKQFNRKVELNAEIRKLKQKINAH